MRAAKDFSPHSVAPMLGLPYDMMQPFLIAFERFVGPRRAHGQ